MCDMYICKGREGSPLGLGLASGGRADAIVSADNIPIQDLVSTSPFPHHEGREPRGGGRKLLGPIKGQRRLTFCVEMPA